MMKSKLLLMIFFLSVSTYSSSSAAALLQEGFYNHSCPSAEGIVRKAVEKAVFLKLNPGIAAGLIRLHFHDCFVRGCDASILLDITAQGSNQTEKKHQGNLRFRGLEVIDEAKAEIETEGKNYQVPAGRRDGRISTADISNQDLPPPFFNLTQLTNSFARKGFSITEMVVLFGAHSIGISACSSFRDRLTNNTHEQLDPEIAAAINQQVRNLRRRCSAAGRQSSEATVPLDSVTPNILDNQYYVNVERNSAALSTDQALMSSPATAKIVRRFARRNRVWARNYGAAMVHMGSIEVLTGSKGEIRKICRVPN